jgi:ABC-type glycerol-3-phosphate transport system substrate-binding protein
MVPLPTGAVNDRTSVATVHEFSIGKASKNKDAAWKLIKYLSGPEGSSVLQRECLWLQSSKKTYGEYSNLMEKLGATGIRYLNQGLERMRPATRTTAFDKVMPLIDQQLFSAYAKRVAPEAALRDAEKAVQPILDRKFRKK